jgi:hypothetical protein
MNMSFAAHLPTHMPWVNYPKELQRMTRTKAMIKEYRASSATRA